MKRITTLAMAAATLLVLSACSSAPAENKATEVEGQKVGQVGTVADLLDITEFCGDKPLTIGYADGNAANSWKKITKAELDDEAAKCPNLTIVHTDSAGDTQKAISDFNGLVAQGVDGIVVLGQAGEALAPAVRKAADAGIPVVPFIFPVGVAPGEGIVDFVSEDGAEYGRTLAEWTIKTMGERGNLVMLGGVAGNSYSQYVYEAVAKAAAAYPGITLLGDGGPVATDWEPGKTQQVVAGLITQYGKINGIVSDYGGGSVGGVRAFLAAGESIPPWSGNDSNQFACLWKDNHAANPGYEIGTLSSRTWLVRLALRKAVAAANGILQPEPSIIQLEIFEDSIIGGDLAPQCNPDLPPDAILSSQLDAKQLAALLK